jgi:glycosyltransferase involved in cell wall biosynthesis
MLLRYYDEIDVVAVKVGEHDLPPRIHVHGIGEGRGKAGKVIRFYRIVCGLLRKHAYSVVFSHMNTHFTVLFWPLAKISAIKQVLWYAHRQTSLLLRLAAWCAERVVTSTKEGFSLPSNKLDIIGQGIDTHIFVDPGTKDRQCDVVTTGRISPSKKIDEIIGQFLAASLPASHLHIIGSPASSGDVVLRDRLQAEYSTIPAIHFVGFKSPAEIADIYRRCSIFVNLSETGSLDKANLEAAAAGLIVVTSNAAFRSFVLERGLFAGALLSSAGDLASLLRDIQSRLEWYRIEHAAIAVAVREAHALDGLIGRLGRVLEGHETNRS